MNQFSYQQGVGLIEVMGAVLLLSVAVLGFSALQLRAISATEESLIRTQALSVVRGLAENMRANPIQMEAYETAINDADENNAVVKLSEHGVTMQMDTCPGTAAFSEIKCIIAAWGDTLPVMNTSANACANENGIYNSGSNCIIVEAY